MELIFITGGSYNMGDVFGDGYTDEQPVHSVAVDDFYLGSKEVTVEAFRAFCHETGHAMPDAPEWGWHDKYPIVNVTWDDAAAFCRWTSCRLPSEAEWEYAARSCGANVKWAGANIEGMVGDYVWSGNNSNGMPHQAATRRANALGLHDMSGNVWEWCQDWYDDKYYVASLNLNPQGPATGEFRVARGGSCIREYRNIRTMNRDRFAPDKKNSFVGFRIARSIQ